VLAKLESPFGPALVLLRSAAQIMSDPRNPSKTLMEGGEACGRLVPGCSPNEKNTYHQGSLSKGSLEGSEKWKTLSRMLMLLRSFPGSSFSIYLGVAGNSG